MDSTRKNVYKVLLFALIIVCLTALFSWILYPRNNYTDDAMDAISGNCLLGEPKNSIDVLFVGDSNAYASVSPLELWKNYGITSYVSATSAQPICETEDFVKAGFEKQTPKLVVLESDNLFRECTIGKYGFTKLKNIIPLLQYHDRWKLIGTDLVGFRDNYTRTDDFKGYKFDSTVAPYMLETAGYMEKDSPYDLGVAVEWSLKDIKSECDKNNSELLIITAPNLNWTNNRHDKVQQLADMLGVYYLDLNVADGLEPIDWKTETKDYGVHVNHSGALKISSCLGRFIQESYGIPDNKNNPSFEYWNAYLEKYEELIKEEPLP
jgi:hypothetical protein